MNIFIVNPAAGNGKARKIYNKIIQLNNFKLKQVKTFFSENEDHLNHIMNEIDTMMRAGSSIAMLIVIGGDGTMHGVVNGLRNKAIPIVYLPGGSGNDFARGIRLRKNAPATMTDALTQQQTLDYWLGCYFTKETNSRKFINCIGFGFDAVVARKASEQSFRNRLQRLGLGKLIYVFALFRELFSYKAKKITVELDGVKREFKHTLFVTVNNHAYFGGGMKINPRAVNNRHKLSILIVENMPKWKVLTLFGTVFIGKHVLFKEVHQFQAREIKIYGDNCMPYQVDGEVGETDSAIIKIDPDPIQLRGK